MCYQPTRESKWNLELATLRQCSNSRIDGKPTRSTAPSTASRTTAKSALSRRLVDLLLDECQGGPTAD